MGQVLLWPQARTELDREQIALVLEAWRARSNAYAPYSRFFVGAALRAVRDQKRCIVRGCNVEHVIVNGVHAEQLAVGNMVEQLGANPRPYIQALAVVLATSDPTLPAFPCMACRGIIAEFSQPNTVVLGGRLSEDGQNLVKVAVDTLGALFPSYPQEQAARLSALFDKAREDPRITIAHVQARIAHLRLWCGRNLPPELDKPYGDFLAVRELL